jgi:hypothetical protein
VRAGTPAGGPVLLIADTVLVLALIVVVLVARSS